jgi:hypothetical protein
MNQCNRLRLALYSAMQSLSQVHSRGIPSHDEPQLKNNAHQPQWLKSSKTLAISLTPSVGHISQDVDARSPHGTAG